MIKSKFRQKGATAIEYALIAALISVLAIAGLNSVGGAVNSTLSDVATSLGASTD